MSDFNAYLETDPIKIFDDVLEKVEKKLGETLEEGDQRKIFIRSLIPVITAIQNKTVDESKQNYLEYARNDRVDVIGNNYNNTKRNMAQQSTCTGKIVLSIAQEEDLVIKKDDIKVTPDGIAMFLSEEDVIIPAGETSANLKLISTSTGSKYNGYKVGKINTLVKPLPYVKEIYNTEISHSGTDLEDDANYKERCRLFYESLSTAGPSGAYEYLAYKADASITAVKVDSPNPGEIKILVVIDNGEIPGEDIFNKVLNVCSARDVRPLTDNVSTGVPDVVNYDIELTYYLDKNLSVYENKWRKAIEGEKFDFKDGAIRNYILWQQEEIGKYINPDELRYKIQDAASYTVDENKISGVRRIEMTNPSYTVLEKTQLAKANNIIIKYGGME